METKRPLETICEGHTITVSYRGVTTHLAEIETIDGLIGLVSPPRAEFIVRAVNSHNAMVEALEHLVFEATGEWESVTVARDMGKAALDKARGE